MVKTATPRKERRTAWKSAQASVRGSAHVRSGLPNQDAVACSVIPGDDAQPSIAIVTVSDGHGGARHFRSQIGSTLAVNTAINALRAFLPRFTGPDGAASLTQDHIDALQRSIVHDWTTAVLADLESNPLSAGELARLDREGDDGRAALEESPALAYGATLLVAAATDDLLLYLQLGDGEILSVSAQGETTRPLPPDERLVGNQTTSLCQPEAWTEFRSAWVVAPNLPALALLSTDGYVNSFRSDDDFLKIGKDYLNILREQGISSLSEELPAILEEATRQGSGDDITLAILQGDLARPHGDQPPVRPPLSTASRSALIEQLKARHSSQDRRIAELSTRLEQTSKTNRRLQVLVLLGVLCALAAGAWFYRDRIFPSQPSPAPRSTHPADRKAGEHDKTLVPTGSQSAAEKAWSLTLDNGPAIPLQKGAMFAHNDIVPGQPPDKYAEVADDKGVMVLINWSDDIWKARTGDGKVKKIEKGEHVVLGSEQIEIAFSKDITGKIAPAAAPAPPSSAPVIPPAPEANQ